MKITYGEIYYSKDGIQSLVKIPMPVITSFKVAKLANKLSKEIQIISVEQDKLITLYGEPGADGVASINPSMNGYKDFVEARNSLFDQELELELEKIPLPLSSPIKCEKCGEVTNVELKLEPSTFMLLDKFIEVEMPTSG